MNNFEKEPLVVDLVSAKGIEEELILDGPQLKLGLKEIIIFKAELSLEIAQLCMQNPDETVSIIDYSPAVRSGLSRTLKAVNTKIETRIYTRPFETFRPNGRPSVLLNTNPSEVNVVEKQQILKKDYFKQRSQIALMDDIENAIGSYDGFRQFSEIAKMVKDSGVDASDAEILKALVFVIEKPVDTTKRFKPSVIQNGDGTYSFGQKRRLPY